MTEDRPNRQRESNGAAILRAMLGCEEPLTVEQLVVAAWKFRPQAFGLRGYEARYPNAARVRETLYGRRGLLTKGLIAKGPDGRLELSEEGMKVLGRAEAKAGDDEDDAPAGGRMHPLLRCAANSRAYELFHGGRQGDITLADSFRFWGLRPAACQGDLGRRLNDFGAAVRRDESQGARLVRHCHEWLLERFSRQLRIAG